MEFINDYISGLMNNDPELIEKLHRTCGYLISEDFGKHVIFTSRTSGGRGAFCKILWESLKFSGQDIMDIGNPNILLKTKKPGKNDHTSHLMCLENHKIILMSDLGPIDLNKLEHLKGPIKIRQIYEKDFRTIVPRIKFLVIDYNSGLESRPDFIHIPFDKNLLGSNKTPNYYNNTLKNYLPEFKTWLDIGLSKYQEHGI